MSYTLGSYVGIDPTAGRNAYTWAVLDPDCRLDELAGGELEEVLALVDRQESALVAINGPARSNLGLLRKKKAGQVSYLHLRGADMRLVEYNLRERGISIPPTPSRPEICAAWTQMGFQLHSQLRKLGFLPFPGGDSPRQLFETNPHAVFCTLLGQVPLPKPTLEGRLQRQLVLHGKGEEINDPMEFFEEITRHKLLRGCLPINIIYTSEELDALAAAFTAWSVINSPEEITILGEKEEGQIILPIQELKEKYT